MGAYRSSTNDHEALVRATRGRLAIEHEPNGKRLRLCLRWWSGRVIISAMSLAVGVGGIAATLDESYLRNFAKPWVWWTIASLYVFMAYLLNSSAVDIDLDAGTLTLEHGPMWWPGGKRVLLSKIRQIYVKRSIYGRKHRRTVEYAVMAQGWDEKATELIGGPLTPSAAQALEETIELYVGITDEPVPGEF